MIDLYGFTECIDDCLVRNIPDDLLAVFIINKAVCLINGGIGFDSLLLTSKYRVYFFLFSVGFYPLKSTAI